MTENYCSHPLNSAWARRLGIRWDDGAARRPCADHDAAYAKGGGLWAKTKADAAFAWNLAMSGLEVVDTGKPLRGLGLVARAPIWWAAVTVGGLWAWKWTSRA